jgi:hypothetical protein
VKVDFLSMMCLLDSLGTVTIFDSLFPFSTKEVLHVSILFVCSFQLVQDQEFVDQSDGLVAFPSSN